MRPTDIATVNMSEATSDAGRRRLAGQIDEICRTLGFVYITEHGVPSDLIDRMYDASARFFLLPESIKANVIADRAGGYRGWEPAGSSSLSRTIDEESPPDLREVFSMGRPNVEDDPYYSDTAEARYFYTRTRWPDEVDDLEAVWHEYFAAMEDLAGRLMRLMEQALGLDDRWFDPFFDRHSGILLANYYPQPELAPEPGQLRAGSHTDYGAFTILYQDSSGSGLQIRDDAGEWTDVQPVAGSFVVNVGDLMARWTNDRWNSTMHRVVVPEPVSGQPPWRISVPFFVQPNLDSVISCIPGCEGAGGPKYEPIRGDRNAYDKYHRSLHLDSRPD